MQYDKSWSFPLKHLINPFATILPTHVALHVLPWPISGCESQVVPVTREGLVGMEIVRSLTPVVLHLLTSIHLGRGSGRRSPDTQLTTLPRDGIFPSMQISVHDELLETANVPSAAIGVSQPLGANSVVLATLLLDVVLVLVAGMALVEVTPGMAVVVVVPVVVLAMVVLVAEVLLAAVVCVPIALVLVSLALIVVVAGAVVRVEVLKKVVPVELVVVLLLFVNETATTVVVFVVTNTFGLDLFAVMPALAVVKLLEAGLVMVVVASSSEAVELAVETECHCSLSSSIDIKFSDDIVAPAEASWELNSFAKPVMLMLMDDATF